MEEEKLMMLADRVQGGKKNTKKDKKKKQQKKDRKKAQVSVAASEIVPVRFFWFMHCHSLVGGGL